MGLPRIVNVKLIASTNKLSPSMLLLGVQGENNATRVVIDASEWADYASGTFVLLVRRADGELFTVALERDGTTLSWDVKGPEIGVHGFGGIELQLISNTNAVKSVCAETRVFSELELKELPPGDTTWSQLVVRAVKDALDAQRYMLAYAETLDIILYVYAITGVSLFSKTHEFLCDSNGNALFAQNE